MALSNRTDGITIYGAALNFIGGTNSGTGNVISGNGGRGVLICTATAAGNVIEGNRIGLNAGGGLRIPNGLSGVDIVNASGNRIGGASPAARNIISGNRQSGVAISGSNSCGNMILGNYVGINLAGTGAVSNGYSGILISGGMTNTIGGTATGARNVVSGNGQSGIVIMDLPARGNVVAGNYVGLAADGVTGLANGMNGVRVETGANRIGGAQAGERNIVSGNRQTGIYLTGSNAVANYIEGNYVGTDFSGTVAVGNGYAGIGLNGARSNWIGGAHAGSGNLASGNGTAGVYLNGAAAFGNRVAGNTLGTDAARRRSLGNLQDGLAIFDAPTNQIGEATAGAGNLISGNMNGGMFISGGKAVGNVIQNNWIGLQGDGATALGNQWHGIEFEAGAGRTLIGGIGGGAGNRIAFALGVGYDGVRIPAGSTNISMHGNHFFSNGGSATAGLGIDLGSDGVTANDASDADGGANLQQNYPLVTNAIGFATTRISGSLRGKASSTLMLDLYCSASADASGYGEGAQWLGSITVTTDGSGTALFQTNFATSMPAGGVITATATDAAGNTSEFGLARTINPGVIASDAAFWRGVGRNFTIAVADLAHDESGGALGVSLGSGNQGAVITSDGTFIYYRPVNDRADSFQYTVTNSFGDSATRRITLGVIPAGGQALGFNRNGNAARFSFLGVSGAAYEVQRSVDLIHWTTVSNLTAPASGQFEIGESPSAGAAFFRLKTQ